MIDFLQSKVSKQFSLPTNVLYMWLASLCPSVAVKEAKKRITVIERIYIPTIKCLKNMKNYYSVSVKTSIARYWITSTDLQR